MLKVVGKIGTGVGFGELALLNDKPRSATIITLENTHFAVLEKENFNEIMAKVLRNKCANQVNFLSNFSFITGMTRITKEKLWYLLERHKYTLGQEVLIESENLNYVYLIEDGEFEINKTMYLLKKRDATYSYYLRSISQEKNEHLDKILTTKSRILYTDNKNEWYHIRSGMKLIPKKIVRISILGKYESFGLTDLILGWPYSSITVKCHSREGTIHRIEKNEFLRRIKHNTMSIIKVARHKLNFLADRIMSLNNTNNFQLPPQYNQDPWGISFDSEIDEINKSNDNKDNITDESKLADNNTIDKSTERANSQLKKYTEVSEAKKKFNRAINKLFIKK